MDGEIKEEIKRQLGLIALRIGDIQRNMAKVEELVNKLE